MKKIIFTEEQIEDIKNLYLNGETTRSIGYKHNVSNKTIARLLNENNVNLRNSGQQYKGGIKASNKRYSEKPEIKIRKKRIYYEWVEINKERRKEYMKKYREKNYDKIKDTKRKYEKRRKSEDPIYKLIGNFRTAIYTVLKENNVSKYGHYFEILGYTQDELVKHLENQFKDGICWDNYGEWHVDHIKPISSFKFETINDIEFKECWSLDNLQPMWGKENISKSNSYIF